MKRTRVVKFCSACEVMEKRRDEPEVGGGTASNKVSGSESGGAGGGFSVD